MINRAKVMFDIVSGDELKGFKEVTETSRPSQNTASYTYSLLRAF